MKSKAKLPFSLGWRLSLLWTLQWGITGAILTYMPIYFEQNGLSKQQVGILYAVSAVGLWIAPFIVGQVCDRWMATEKYLAIAHLFGGMTLLAIPVATDMFRTTGENFSALMVLMGTFSAFYFPTIPLASAMTFRHLPDPQAQFGKVRIWGTVGWVMSGWFLSVWLGRSDAYAWLAETFPNFKPTLDQFTYAFRWVSAPDNADCFKLGALLSFMLSSFCIFMPATPPARAPKSKIAPLAMLSMFKDRTFSLMIGISFLMAILVPLYNQAAPTLLKQLGYPVDWIPAIMTIGQISEFPALLLLPLLLRVFGMKLTFAIGMGAWLLRYAMFAMVNPETFVLFDPAWLILTAIGLNGVCHVCLIIVIQLYVDRRTSPDLRASAQNLFAFITMGIAMPVGMYLGGELLELLTDPVAGRVNYQLFFLMPAVTILILLFVFYRFVRIDDESAAARPKAGDDSLAPESTRAV